MMPNETAINGIGQRADLTFKYNLASGRHGWLRLTPAYSVKIVEDILREYKKKLFVLDPFSGTATTTLCAASRGHFALSVEINPFLVWLGQAKLSQYSPEDLVLAKESAQRMENLISSQQIAPVPPPPISNIEKWWEPGDLLYLRQLRACLDDLKFDNNRAKNLLETAFCRTLIGLSRAAFNHQSLSFRTPGKIRLQEGFWSNKVLGKAVFKKELDFILNSALPNPEGIGKVIKGDARAMDQSLDRDFDLLISSPPYPNRISYIRELRPYMYWLGYLKNSRQAGEMDWEAIGGTWGIATSRLSKWKRNSSAFSPLYLERIIKAISESDTVSGSLLSKYIDKYFEDIWQHLVSAKKIMKPKSAINYIVGNSKFYDIVVPVEQIYRDMLKEAGFKKVEVRILRKRNSKKELFEFQVSARL